MSQETESKQGASQESGANDAQQKLANKYKKEDSQGIQLYYWQMKNRGNFIKYLFAEGNVDYELIEDAKEVSKKCKCRNAMEDSALRFDPFAPPFIYHKGRMLSQSMPMMMYVAELTGLRPTSVWDNLAAAMVCENASDTWGELTRQIGKSEEEVSKFLNGRMQHFLDILEKGLHHGDAKRDYYFENRLTYPDVCVANVLDGFHEIFVGGLYHELVTKTHPKLEALYQRVTQRKNIKALLDKQAKAGLVWYPPRVCQSMLDILANLAKKLDKGDDKQKDVKDQPIAA